ncbi:unnamed protein product [Mycena citricolor]|uniref:PHD-type domain-containing protein n=1 Tax=Mycena citricolor TaxID=2018698 RepID=A0AAD2H9C7_9AGAR|nr:unnamed protein product [Mycena citricolor]
MILYDQEIEQDFRRIPNIDSRNNPHHIDIKKTPDSQIPAAINTPPTRPGADSISDTESEGLQAAIDAVEQFLLDSIEPATAPRPIPQLSVLPPPIVTLDPVPLRAPSILLTKSDMEIDLGPQPEDELLSSQMSDGANHLRCDGCGEERDDADDSKEDGEGEGEIIQCDGPCKLWSHTACLDDSVDWTQHNVRFLCRECDVPQPGSVLPVTYPNMADPLDVYSRIYPAVVVKRHIDRQAQSNEYELQWSELVVSGPEPLGTFFLPRNTVLYYRMICGQGKVPHAKIGKYRLPWSQNPDSEAHNESDLRGIFTGAIPAIVATLVAWDRAHPVVNSWLKYSESQAGKKISGAMKEMSWIVDSLQLRMTGELESCLGDAAGQVMCYKDPTFQKLPQADRYERVHTVGTVLLHLLFMQRELGEPLDVGGETFENYECSKIAWNWEIERIHRMMDGLHKPEVASDDILEAGHVERVNFKQQHCVLDRDTQLRAYRRIGGVAPTSAVVPVVPKRARERGEDVQPGPRPQPRPVNPKFKRRKAAGVAPATTRQTRSSSKK